MPSTYQEIADAAYNAPSRQIEAKLEIYFSGVPLVVTKDNFLISFNVLEELGVDSTTSPIGDTSANTLSIKLLNTNGIFSPSNASSPYYGLMKAGVRIDAFMKEASLSNWESMGTFYVDDWYAEVTSLQASVVCFDNVYNMFNTTHLTPRAIPNATYKQAFDSFLSSFVFNHEIDPELGGALTWWYAKDTNIATLQELSEASLAAVYCDRYNTVVVDSMTKYRTTRATLSDAEQIIRASVPQSINKAYDGLAIMLNSHQLTDIRNLLDISEYNAPVGLNESSEYDFTAAPVARIESVKVVSKSPLVKYVKHSANTNVVSFMLSNDGFEPFKVNLVAYGRLAEIIKTSYNKYGSKPLVLDNTYVQTADQAALHTEVLDRFIRSNLPNLRLETRGNPTIHLGDKVRVVSSMYSLDFVGIVQRASYSYSGFLKCDLNIVASNVLEVT